MPHARRASSKYENSPAVLVRVTVTKPLPAGRQAFRSGSNDYVPAHRSACVSARRRELLKTKNVTQSCSEPPFILREPQDERRVEGDDTGLLAVTVRRDIYFLAIGYGLDLWRM